MTFLPPVIAVISLYGQGYGDIGDIGDIGEKRLN
jgi:hypothetical protein